MTGERIIPTEIRAKIDIVVERLTAMGEPSDDSPEVGRTWMYYVRDAVASVFWSVNRACEHSLRVPEGQAAMVYSSRMIGACDRRGRFSRLPVAQAREAIEAFCLRILGCDSPTADDVRDAERILVQGCAMGI